MKKMAFAFAMATTLSMPFIGVITVHASEDDNMCAQIASAVQSSGSNVCVSMHDGVATLSGYVESATERMAAEKAAAGTEGVNKVINLITVSN